MYGTRIALSLLALALLTACGDGTGTAQATPTAPPGTSAGPSAGSSTAPVATGSAESPPTAPERALGPPTGTEEVEVARTLDEPPMVTRARFGGHQGFDRVVIDFDGPVPGYTVRWVDELVQDGSGDTIPVEGGAYLQVTLTPANAHTEEGEPTWTGGPIFQAGLANVSQVVKTGDFEAVVGVGLVLDHKAAFRAIEQKNPDRLVIDVAH